MENGMHIMPPPSVRSTRFSTAPDGDAQLTQVDHALFRLGRGGLADTARVAAEGLQDERDRHLSVAVRRGGGGAWRAKASYLAEVGRAEEQWASDLGEDARLHEVGSNEVAACTRSGGVVEKKCSNSQPSTASLMACTMTSFMPAPKRLPAAASFSARASAFCDILSASSFLPSFRLPELCLVSFRLPARTLLPLKPPPCSRSAGVSTMSFRPAFIGLSRSVCSPLSGFRLRFGLALRGVLLESPPLESPSETRRVTSDSATAALLSVENRCSPALRLAFGLPSVSLAIEAGLGWGVPVLGAAVKQHARAAVDHELEHLARAVRLVTYAGAHLEAVVRPHSVHAVCMQCICTGAHLEMVLTYYLTILPSHHLTISLLATYYLLLATCYLLLTLKR
eukprot:scaffold33274_cov69-Phaeocystis_antarctica.AAC.6